MTRSHRTFITLASACACSLLGGTALGANSTIAVGNNKTLSPASPTITLGDTITWAWVGPDTGHIIESLPSQAESWDSDPGVAPADASHSIGDTFVHQFTHTGAFNYHCRVHPDKMFGVITVNNPASAPTASFTVTPSLATVGETVSFDGTASSDPDGPLTAWEWDLDGDGTFETSGATPSRAYSVPGQINVQLRVTDSTANTNTTSQLITIAAAAAAPITNPFIPPVVVPPPPAVTKLVFTGAAKQRAADKRGVTVVATCNLTCMLSATGSISLPGGKKVVLTAIKKALAAGVQTKVVLMVPKAARPTVKKLLAKGKTLTASLVLKTADGSKSTKTFKLVR